VAGTEPARRPERTLRDLARVDRAGGDEELARERYTEAAEICRLLLTAWWHWWFGDRFWCYQTLSAEALVRSDRAVAD
jgi:hypothetical protein